MVRALLFWAAFGAQSAPDSHENLMNSRIALKGMDPLSYFAEGGGAPKKGREDLEVVESGMAYQFSEEKNRDLFLADPDRFQPAYGGWCAEAMSRREQVDIDPSVFVVQDGRLFLFHSEDRIAPEADWTRNMGRRIQEADMHWSAQSGRRPPAAVSSTVKHSNLGRNALAIEGYDPLSYFPEGGSKPARGSSKISARYRGALYFFENDKSRQLFLREPGKYAPAYGGWCAYAMGNDGSKVEVDAEAFRITDGALCLFYRSFFSDTRKDWDKDTARLKKNADHHWSEILGRK